MAVAPPPPPPVAPVAPLPPVAAAPMAPMTTQQNPPNTQLGRNTKKRETRRKKDYCPLPHHPTVMLRTLEGGTI